MKKFIYATLSLVGLFNAATVQALPGLNFDPYYNWGKCVQVSSARTSTQCSVTVTNAGGPAHCKTEQALSMKVHISIPKSPLLGGALCIGTCGTDMIFDVRDLGKNQSATVSRDHEGHYCQHRVTDVKKVR